MCNMKEFIESGKAVLGIELGSTRIKAVLTDNRGRVIADGGFEWENQLVDGIWTYSLDEVHKGLRACYKDLAKNVKDKYDITLKNIGAIGISAMMHGYLIFDKDDNLLAPLSKSPPKRLGYHEPEPLSPYSLSRPHHELSETSST